MKIIKIIMLIAVLLFSLPFGLVAEEHAEDMCAHSCLLVCHTCCHNAVTPHMELPPVVPASLAAIFVSDFSYQNPSLDTFKRPPVVSA